MRVKFDSSITVTTTHGKTQTATATADTKFSKMNTAIALKYMKVGDHVVIHATKKDGKLLAATVQVGMESMKGMKINGSSIPGAEVTLTLAPGMAFGFQRYWGSVSGAAHLFDLCRLNL